VLLSSHVGCIPVGDDCSLRKLIIPVQLDCVRNPVITTAENNNPNLTLTVDFIKLNLKIMV